MILAMDTSTALTSVALVDGRLVLAQRAERDPRRHAEVLAPLLAQVLSESGAAPSEIDTIACGVGPGPYTGLRVAIATARALGMAWRRPVVGLCSLDAIAAAVVDVGVASDFGVASDARRREVYWGWFDERGVRTLGPQVMRPQDIDVLRRQESWAGQGAHEHEADFGRLIRAAGDGDALRYPHARWIASRVDALMAAGDRVRQPHLELSAHGGDGAGTSRGLAGLGLLPPEPLYLRRPDAVESAPTAAPGSTT